MLFLRRTVVAAAATTMLIGAGAAVAAAPSTVDTPGAPTVQLSWTARILYPIAVRSRPGGRIIQKLQHYTAYSQAPAVYMVTDQAVVKNKRWIQIQLAKRPNGSRGWVPEDAVDLRRTKTWIKVSTARRTVQVLIDGQVKKTFRVGVGTGGTPTPKGLFAILDPVPTNGQLGPYILVLTAHSTVLRTFAGGDGIVGIHGWPSSNILGKAVSHGCVRMARSDVRILRQFAKPGTPVQIV